MGDLVIEAGAFKVGASSKDAQALLREKLDQDGILADIAQIDNEVGELTTLARPSPTLALPLQASSSLSLVPSAFMSALVLTHGQGDANFDGLNVSC